MSKLFTNFAAVLFTAALTIGMVACSKGSDLANTGSSVSQNAPKNIMRFDSYEALSLAINRSLEMSMSPAAMRVPGQGTSNGFISFGEFADMAYEDVAQFQDDYKSIEEVRAAVAQHSDYLQLIQDENGDYTLETKLENSDLQYIVNDEYMLQVKDTLIKVLLNTEISDPVKNYEVLLGVNEAEIDKLVAKAQQVTATNDWEFQYEFTQQLNLPVNSINNSSVNFKVYKFNGSTIVIYGDNPDNPDNPQIPKMNLGRGFELKDYKVGSDGKTNRLIFKLYMKKWKYTPSNNEFIDEVGFKAKSHRKNKNGIIYWRTKRYIEPVFDAYAANIPIGIQPERVYWKWDDPVYNWKDYGSATFYSIGKNVSYFTKIRGSISTYDGTYYNFYNINFINLDYDNY